MHFKKHSKPIAFLEDFEPLSSEEIRKKKRIPPGQHLAKRWPVLSVEAPPQFNGKDWDIEVTGLVENPTKWTWSEFLKLPKVEITCDIHCVTSWSLLDQRFGGVLFKTITDIVQPKKDAKYVTFEAYSGYTSALPLYDGYLDQDNVILAYEYQGKPLPLEHGGPLRLVVPHLYFWKSVKWVKKIHFLDVWERGFWEVRGYHQRGDPWKEERYSSQERPRRRDHKIL